MNPSEPSSDASSHHDSTRPDQVSAHDTSPSQDGSRPVFEEDPTRIRDAIAQFESACSTAVGHARRAHALASEQISHMRDEVEAGRRSSAELPGHEDYDGAIADMERSIADMHSIPPSFPIVTRAHGIYRILSASRRAADEISWFDVSHEEWGRAHTMWSGLEEIDGPIDAEGEASG